MTSDHRLRRGLPGYLILFDPHAFVPQRQYRLSKLPSQLVFCAISKHFTATRHIPPTSSALKSASIKADWATVEETIKDVKLRTFVVPGSLLKLSAKLIHDGSGFAVTKAEGRFEDKPIFDATITFRIMPFPNAEFRASMQQVAERIAFPIEAVDHG